MNQADDDPADDWTARLQSLAALELAPRTLATYAAVMRRYDAWCAAAGHDPTAAQSAQRWLMHHHDQQHSESTIRQALAALRRWHELAGRPDPFPAGLARRMLGGITRSARRQSPPHEAPALRLLDWRSTCARLHRATGPTHRPIHYAAELGRRQIASRDLAIIVLGYLGALRTDELVGLQLADVTTAPEGLALTLRRRKAHDAPSHVLVPSGQYEETDPVRVLAAYLERHPDPRESSPLFVRSDTSGTKLYPAPIAHRAITRLLQRALTAAAVPAPQSYTAHSLRAGLATELAEAGAPLPAIANTGGWSQMQTLLSYARRAHHWSDAPQRRLTY